MKRALRKATLKRKMIFKDYTEIAAYLRGKFSDEWQEEHKVGAGHTVNAVEVFEVPSSEIRNDTQAFKVYDSVGGVRKSFGYLALSDGVVLQRWFDCWCGACAVAAGPGDRMAEVARDSGYHVKDCVLPEPEPWWHCSVQLQGTRGLYAQKKIAQFKGRKLAAKLEPNTFVAVQDRSASGRQEHYLIGVTVDCGNGSCILKQVQKDREHIDGTRFDTGDFAIAVRWLTRLAEDPQQRTFELDTSSEQFIINSTELRFSELELDKHEVQPITPVVRRSNRGMTKAQSHQGKVLNKKYVVPILKYCY